MSGCFLGCALVVAAFAKDWHVSHGNGEGFGSGALKVDGKICTMMSSEGKFVVKLSKRRVDDLVASGEGEYFDHGHGRYMKEWGAMLAGKTSWVDLAQEAHRFVKGGILRRILEPATRCFQKLSGRRRPQLRS